MEGAGEGVGEGLGFGVGCGVGEAFGPPEVPREGEPVQLATASRVARTRQATREASVDFLHCIAKVLFKPRADDE